MGCWFSLCTSGGCLGTPHNFVLFFFFLVVFLNVLIKPHGLYTVTLPNSSTDYSVGQICLQIETKEFCTVQKNESHIPNIAVVVVNCQTLKITFNRN